MLQAGVTAPAFTLRDLAGNEKSLDRILSSGPALLALFKVSCPVCQFAFPFLERIATQGNLQVIAVSQDDAKSTTQFRAKLGITLPTLLDESGYPVSNAFGITTVPSLFLVEPDGLISMASEGFSKADIEEVGRRAGVIPFRPNEKIPALKAG